jgi:hypothetical protein
MTTYCCDYSDSGSISADGVNAYIYYTFVLASQAPVFIAGNPPSVAEVQTMYNTKFPNNPATVVYLPQDAFVANDFQNINSLSANHINAYIYYTYMLAAHAPSFIAGNPPSVAEVQTMYNTKFPNDPVNIVKLPVPFCTPTPTPTMTPTVTPTHTPTPTPTPGLQVGFQSWASFMPEGAVHDITVEKKSTSPYIPNVKWTVDWKTTESGNNTVPGVATMGTVCGGSTDFLEASGTIVFERYEGTKTISVTSCADSIADPVETFNIELFNLSAEDSYFAADPAAVVSFYPSTSSHIVWLQ